MTKFIIKKFILAVALVIIVRRTARRQKQER